MSARSALRFLRQANPLPFFDIRMQLVGVPGGEILTKVGTPAFFTGKCAFMNQTSDGEQVGFLRDIRQRFQASFKLFGIADNSRMAPSIQAFGGCPA